MPKKQKDATELETRTTSSLVLGIESFYHPSDQGRAECVLIFPHHAFERLLKIGSRKKGADNHPFTFKNDFGARDWQNHLQHTEFTLIKEGGPGNEELITLSSVLISSYKFLAKSNS